MKKTILFFSILLASCAGKQTQEIRTMERLSTASHNDYYVSNRAPLQPLQFIKLPAGSIEPEGWIRRQIDYRRMDFVVIWGRLVPGCKRKTMPG